MAKETRASSILGGGEKKEKKQPKRGVEKRKKAHSIHARRVENGFHTETKLKGDNGEEETQEHIHPDIQSLLSHISDKMGEEQEENPSGNAEPTDQNPASPQGGSENL